MNISINAFDSNDELLTPSEAAGLLRISVRTIYRMCKRQEFRVTRVGKQWRILKSDVVKRLPGQES